MVNTWNDHNLQITPLYNIHRDDAKMNSQQYNRFWAFWESYSPGLRNANLYTYMTGFRAGKRS